MTAVGPQGRRDGRLPVACWCMRQMRPLTEDEVWAGSGWRCTHRHCLPEGPLYMRWRRSLALAESWRLRHELRDELARLRLVS